jgi:hypothetical protein
VRQQHRHQAPSHYTRYPTSPPPLSRGKERGGDICVCTCALMITAATNHSPDWLFVFQVEGYCLPSTVTVAPGAATLLAASTFLEIRALADANISRHIRRQASPRRSSCPPRTMRVPCRSERPMGLTGEGGHGRAQLPQADLVYVLVQFDGKSLENVLHRQKQLHQSVRHTFHD